MHKSYSSSLQKYDHLTALTYTRLRLPNLLLPMWPPDSRDLNPVHYNVCMGSNAETSLYQVMKIWKRSPSSVFEICYLSHAWCRPTCVFERLSIQISRYALFTLATLSVDKSARQNYSNYGG